MGTGWRRARNALGLTVCTSIPRDHLDALDPATPRTQTENVSSPRVLTDNISSPRLQQLENMSPRLQCQTVSSPRLRCQTAVSPRVESRSHSACSSPGMHSQSQPSPGLHGHGPMLQCRTNVSPRLRSMENISLAEGSVPSSPRSPSRLSILRSSVRLSRPGWLFRYEPELDAFLQFLIWRFSIWVDKPTPGNALMNLRYRDERAMSVIKKEEVRTGLEGPGLTLSQKLWYCLSMVGGRYAWARLQSFSAFRSWGDSEQRSWPRRAWVLLERAESFYKAASFFNLLLFLYTGRYRSLIERVLRARLVYERPNMSRAVSFEYMNRQLVWNEFSELLLLILPLLNITSIKKILLSPFSKDESDGTAAEDGACPICGANPITVSFIAVPCEHKYCYYCLRTRCTAGSSFQCLRCNAQVMAIKRHGTQVNTLQEK